jgi:hypothetical protein
MDEFEAGPGQVLVVYTSGDTGGEVSAPAFARDIAADAARRAAGGWRIVSESCFPVRQTGTAGNVFFQSGGQFATQLSAIVVYARSAT